MSFVMEPVEMIDDTPLCPLEHNPGVMLRVHDPARCAGQICCIHNRTNHSMRMFPQHWRGDVYMMERICPHGIGHPDPDHLDAIRRIMSDKTAKIQSVHGCDGCCR